LYPSPPGLLRVQVERSIDFDTIAVVHLPLAAAQLAEDPHVCRPGHLERARLRTRGGERIAHGS
jgi:hypothetical protein